MLDKNSVVFTHKQITISILIIAFIIRLLVIINHGVNLSLNSDDMGYVNSAINLLENGILSYHDPNEPTVHIMPGMTLILSVIFFIFGSGENGMYAAKIVFISIGTFSVFAMQLFAYSITKSKVVGYISALVLALYIPQVLIDNLLLTEVPFTASYILLMYFSVKLIEEKSNKFLIYTVFCYLICLYLRPTIAVYPVLILIMMIFTKYPLKKMLKQTLISAVIVLVCLSPWWIRNYVVFHEFIPLSGGSGNPLLLGTFQGTGYPDTLDLETTLELVDSSNEFDNWYERFQVEENIAKERIQEWWDNDKSSLLYSYLYLKPKLMWEYAFYWINIFDFKANTIHKTHTALLLLSVLGYIISFFKKDNRLNLYIIFLVFNIFLFTYLYSIYFSFNRYNQTLIPIIIIGVAILFFMLIEFLRKIRINKNMK